ncbi:MAG: EamA family transporter [Alphaproteobacteria bacterium]|nr:EamA family transporter [Alphaproteobacteria bacterium]
MENQAPTQTAPAQGQPPADQPLQGIIAMLLSAFFFAIITALVKQLGQDYDILQVAFFRCLIALAVLAPYVRLKHGGWHTMRTKQMKWHLFRTATGLTCMLCIFYSFSMMPLADAMSLSASGPIFTALCAIVLLREKVGWQRWAAIIIGFAGVVVMLQPGADTESISGAGIALALASAFFFGLTMTNLRLLGRTEAPLVTVFYFSLFSAVLCALPMPFVWKMPSLDDLPLFILCGLCAVAVQIFVTRAYFYAPAAIVTPFNYTAIIWGGAFGYFFWGDLPGTNMVVGAVIVMLASAMIAWREAVVARRRRAVPPVPAAPPLQ